MTDTTFVTAAIDVGRGQLGADFARPFSFYEDLLAELAGLDIPLVVYGEPALEVALGPQQELVPVDLATLEQMPGFRQIQEIRASDHWLAQAAWLPSSPQARLPHYNPLVMSKLTWLAQEARRNRFGSRAFVWIDAGLAHTVALDLLQRTLTSPALSRRLEKFLFICFPYRVHDEVHGFERAAMERLAGHNRIRWVARGGFFGGQASYVIEAERLYRALLSYTLQQNLMGTEESIFTIMAHLHGGMFDTHFVEDDGLIWRFFADLTDGGESP